MVPVSTSTLSELADSFTSALEEADVDALVELFAPDGTLEVAAAFTAVGTARIREETHASLRRSGQLKLERLTTTIDDDRARLTVGITMSLSDGISVGPLPATLWLERRGDRLTRVKISDYQGAGVDD